MTIYKNIVQGKFIERPNRFIAHCEVIIRASNE